MMDSQRPFLYITLIFIGFLLWMNWQNDYNSPQPSAVETTENGSATTGVVTDDSVPAQPNSRSPIASAPNDTQQIASNDEEQLIQVRTDVLELQISTRGGDIVVADLPTYPVSLEEPDNPVRILDWEDEAYAAQSGLLVRSSEEANKRAPTHQDTFTAAKSEYVLQEGEDTLRVPLTWESEDGVTVTKIYNFRRGQFAVGMEQLVQNNSDQSWAGTEYRQLQHGPPPPQPGGFLTSGVRAFVGGAYYVDDAYKKVSFDDMIDGVATETIDGVTRPQIVTGGWVSMLEHYFISAWVAPRDAQTRYFSKEIGNQLSKRYILGMYSDQVSLAPGQSGSFNSTLWVGPKLQDDLETIAEGLDLTVDYGIFAFISKPIFWVMQWIHSIVGNWGWTIIFLTLLIKLIFFWPSAASYKSMAKMKAVAPRLKELNERYSDDPQAKQKAMMEIYRKEKINPLGGCLPILIQIPVFMGLYWVLLESVELRQAPWLLWYKDLSIRDPYFVLPIIMGVSMFLQQKLNPPPADPMQQKIFQFLPLIFTVMFLWFPAGLVLYWVVNNILSIAQQWFINNKIVGKPKTE